MKKHVLLMFVMMVLLTAYSQNASAQRYYVDVRPTAPVIVKTEAPSPNHVWVADEWSWQGDRYKHVPPHWEVPQPQHRYWVPGYWKLKERQGHYWVPGHWK